MTNNLDIMEKDDYHDSWIVNKDSDLYSGGVLDKKE
jgi:hypothetical protein